MQGIYKIENTINGKVYVGQSINIKDRLSRHYRNLKANRHPNIHLQSAWNKYGEDNFTFSIIEECVKEKLNEREIFWITELGCFNDKKKGYNRTLGGEGNKGRQPSEDTIEKLRKRFTNNNYNSKLVICDDKVFISAKSCSLFYNINYFTMVGWLKGDYGMPKKFYDMKLSYLYEDFKGYLRRGSGSNQKNNKKVICDGMVYSSIADCARFYGINRDTMAGWIKGKHKMPDNFIEIGLSFYEVRNPEEEVKNENRSYT